MRWHGVCEVFRKNKKDLFRPPLRLLSVTCDRSPFCYCSTVIGRAFSGNLWLADLLQWVINESSCYRPQSSVIVHMLSSKGLYYCPQSYVIVQGAMFLSTGLCNRPGGGILRPTLSSTELCFGQQGYVIVHRAMLLSMWWYSQTHVIVHRAMLSSTELCYHQCGGILSSSYHPQSYVIVHRAML